MNRRDLLKVLGAGAASKLGAAPVPQIGVTIYSNFDAGCAMTQPVAATVNGYYNGPIAVAFPFTTPSMSTRAKTFKITLQNVVDVYVQSVQDHDLSVSIRSDSANTPNAILWESRFMALGLEPNVIKNNIVSNSGLALSSSTKYWFVLYGYKYSVGSCAFQWLGNLDGVQGTFLYRAAGDQMWYSSTGLLPALEIYGTRPCVECP